MYSLAFWNRHLFEPIPTLSVSNTAERRFVQGFVDGFLRRAYNDGVCSRHRFQICIPLPDPYRLGFLEGLNCR